MPTIPRTQQYYPSVPLSELSDLYSKGDNRLNDKRIFIISYLPKTLRLGGYLSFNNKYVLFATDTPDVDSINWEYSLFLNGELMNDYTFLNVVSPANEVEYVIHFQNDVTDISNKPLFDKLRITCTIRKNSETIILSVEHNLVEMLDAISLPSVDEVSGMSVPFSGNPETTNYILNHIKDYFQADSITWNNTIVEIGTLGKDTLLKIVTAIIYHNILVSQNISSESSFFIDINEHTNIGMKSFLNEGIPYVGNFENGFFRIPLHILNDILIKVDEIPDFTTMDTGSGNAIYNIIHDTEVIAEDDVAVQGLAPDPEKIQDSKLRITNEIPRLVELFNLTLFPKSALKLTAILIKYLFECSKKNDCKECKDRTDAWPLVPLEGLSDYPDFLVNILTHYFKGPSNNVRVFSQDATSATSLVWSPAVYAILNVAPRIIKAYFARKVVRQIMEDIDGEPTPTHIFDFERIDSTAIRVDQNGQRIEPQPNYDSILGKKVYIIVETLHCRNKQITVNVQTENTRLTGVRGETLLLLSGREDTSQLDENYVGDIQKLVGNFDDLKNNNNSNFNSKEIEYLKIDHQDKVIIKLRIKPKVRALFQGGPDNNPQGWTRRLANGTAYLKILARMINTPAIFGHDFSAAKDSCEFISTKDPYVNEIDPEKIVFRLINRNLYEIYSESGINSWNFLTEEEGNRKKIGKVENTFIQEINNDSTNDLIQLRKISFYYYDQLDNEHFIADCQIYKPRRRRTGRVIYKRSEIGATTVIVDNFLNNYPANGNRLYEPFPYHNPRVFELAGPGIQPQDEVDNNQGESRRKYFASHDHNTVHAVLNRDLYDQIFVRGVHGVNAIVSYELDTSDPNQLRVELIRMPDEVNTHFVINDLQKLIQYQFTDTQRRYANPGCFAAFIGVLGETNLAVRSSGMCFEDATSYPSVSHPNGNSIDTSYFTAPITADPAVNNTAVNQQKQQRMVNAFMNWGFNSRLKGEHDNLNWLQNATPFPNHNDHLHCGGFALPIDTII